MTGFRPGGGAGAKPQSPAGHPCAAQSTVLWPGFTDCRSRPESCQGMKVPSAGMPGVPIGGPPGELPMGGTPALQCLRSSRAFPGVPPVDPNRLRGEKKLCVRSVGVIFVPVSSSPRVSPHTLPYSPALTSELQQRRAPRREPGLEETRPERRANAQLEGRLAEEIVKGLHHSPISASPIVVFFFYEIPHRGMSSRPRKR
jgi:hypothetical protein